MYLIPLDQIEQVLTHVKTAFPLEASGLLIRREVKQFTVLSIAPTSPEENTPFSFRIRDATVAEIMGSLKGSSARIAGCFHSHVFGVARPSARDCAAKKEAGDLWLIYSWRFRNLTLFEWDSVKFQRELFRIIPSFENKLS
jgi:proteasome lid subunit RPN8/RPN11